MDPRLTVLLPLKGRPLFTLRFLWHANRARMPYHFLIADGEVHPELAKLLENSRALFPHLDIEYIRYPDDSSFALFFKKISDALSRVHTRYVVMADNDDFLVSSGINSSLDFLDQNPDYVCAGGGIAGISLYSGLDDADGGLFGRLNRAAFRYTSYDNSRDFSSPSVTERLRQGTRYWWTYYAVYRTEDLATIWREVVDIDFSDLQVHELFCTMRALTLGKARSDGENFSYVRQYGTSLGAAYKKDWVNHLLRSNFTSDIHAMISRISHLAAEADGVDAKDVSEELRTICEGWLREFLWVYFGTAQVLKQFLRDRTPGLVHWLKNRRRYSVALERRSLISNLKNSGASEDYLETFRAELSDVEDTVSGEACAEFIQPFRSVLT